MSGIRLKDGKSEVFVSTKGATVIDWRWRGKDILFPMRKIDGGKFRGGIPICFPFWGESSIFASEIGKHGWLRNQEFEIFECSKSMAMLYSDKPKQIKVYPWQLETKVIIKLNDNILEIVISVSRGKDGVSGKAPILPAFHPYFSNPIGGFVRVGDSAYDVPPNSSVSVIPAINPIVIDLFRIGDVEIRLSESSFTPGLPHVALWTDSIQYFCVEPIFQDPKSFFTATGKYLNQGEGTSMSCSFAVW